MTVHVDPAPPRPQPVDDPLLTAVRRAGFTMVTGVPDSPLAAFASALTAHRRAGGAGPDYLPGTREDACLALAAGDALAGGSPLVFMKSAGFGNCLDVLTSLVQVYAVPVVLLVSWAGHGGNDVPHHNVIGQPLADLCDAIGMTTIVAAMPGADTSIADTSIADTSIADTLTHALNLARGTQAPVAVLAVPEGL